MSALTQMALAKILKRRLRKQQSEVEDLRRRVEALTPTTPAALCDIYCRDVLSFLDYEELIKCRQVSVELDKKICAWQSRGRLPSRTVVGLRIYEVGFLLHVMRESLR